MNIRSVTKSFGTNKEMKYSSSTNRYGIYIQAIHGNEWKKHLNNLKQDKRSFTEEASLKNLMKWEDTFQRATHFIASIKGAENANRLKIWESCLDTYATFLKIAEKNLAIEVMNDAEKRIS